MACGQGRTIYKEIQMFKLIKTAFIIGLTFTTLSAQAMQSEEIVCPDSSFVRSKAYTLEQAVNYGGSYTVINYEVIQFGGLDWSLMTFASTSDPYKAIEIAKDKVSKVTYSENKIADANRRCYYGPNKVIMTAWQ